jgi:hypothetical protein
VRHGKKKLIGIIEKMINIDDHLFKKCTVKKFWKLLKLLNQHKYLFKILQITSFFLTVIKNMATTTRNKCRQIAEEAERQRLAQEEENDTDSDYEDSLSEQEQETIY